MITIYYNPDCSKCNETCVLLDTNSKKYKVVEYLKHPPSAEELRTLIQKLGVRPEELIRKKEFVFKEKFSGKQLSDEEWIDAMINHPILIERPIVVEGDKAVICRPPEKLLEFLK